MNNGPAADALRAVGVLGAGIAGLYSRPADRHPHRRLPAEVQSAIDAFKPILLRACEGLSCTLQAGGTTAGISGLAGDVAQQSGGNVRAFGYLPRSLPRGAQEDRNPERFARQFNSSGSDFSPLEPLQGWTDILAAGVDPRRVKLLSYAGGPISCAECILAVALGAGGRGGRRYLAGQPPVQRAAMARVCQPRSASHGRHDHPRLPAGGRTPVQTR